MTRLTESCAHGDSAFSPTSVIPTEGRNLLSPTNHAVSCHLRTQQSHSERSGCDEGAATKSKNPYPFLTKSDIEWTPHF